MSIQGNTNRCALLGPRVDTIHVLSSGSNMPGKTTLVVKTGSLLHSQYVSREESGCVKGDTLLNGKEGHFKKNHKVLHLGRLDSSLFARIPINHNIIILLYTLESALF